MTVMVVVVSKDGRYEGGSDRASSDDGADVAVMEVVVSGEWK